MVQEITYQPIVHEFVALRVVEVPKSPSIYCSCISTSRLLGANLPKGDAKDLQRNGIPSVGGVVILKYGDIYHTAYIAYLFPGAMYIKEGNYPESCKYNERTLLFTDEHIIGFWNEF